MRVGAITSIAWVASAALCWATQSSASGQTAVALAVASVKPNTSGSSRVSFGGVRAAAPDAAAGVAPNDRAALFTALQEQLGLKLESAKGPVEFVVIEAAERPTAD